MGEGVGSSEGGPEYQRPVATVTSKLLLDTAPYCSFRCTAGVSFWEAHRRLSQRQAQGSPQSPSKPLVPCLQAEPAKAVTFKSYKPCSGVRQMRVQSPLPGWEALRKLLNLFEP